MVAATERSREGLQKLFDFQTNIAHFYYDLGLTRMKALSDVEGGEALQVFCPGQLITAGNAALRMIDDTMLLVHMCCAFKAEFGELA